MNAVPRRSALRLVPALLGLLALAACNLIPPPQTDPTRYFVLNGPALNEATTPAAPGAWRLGLKAVDLPPYLKKGLLVVRQGENEILFNEYARWAEPLEANLGRVLRARLAADAKVARVFAAPFAIDEERDFDVSIRVIRGEGLRQGADRAVVRFAAVIEITAAGAGAELVTRRVFTAPDAAWDGKDYGALAQALSADVAALGSEVIAALPAKK